MQKRTMSVLVEFVCDLEIANKTQFQAEGHFVSGAVAGDTVYNLTLISQRKVQVARVQADDADKAVELMEQSIKDLVNASGDSNAIQKINWDQYMDLRMREATLSTFMFTNYPDTAGKFSTVTEWAIHHLMIERRRWSVRVGKWLAGLKSQSTEPRPKVDHNGE